MKRLVSLALIFLLSINGLFAQAERWDQLVEIIKENNQARGSVSISKAGQIVYENHFDQEDREKVYRYHIGSISKTFTSTLVLLAVEEGKLELSEPLTKWFPSFDENIDIAQMLLHRSGLHNFTDDAAYQQFMEQPQSEKDMIARLSLMEMDFEPGTKQAYSNTNFVLLSYILEKVYQKKYPLILREKIIDRLQLKNTYYGNVESLDDRERDSYYYSGKWNEASHTHPSIPLGAGGIVSSPQDLNRFFEALLTGEVLSDSSLELMKPSSGMGMGLIRFPFYDKYAFGHNGGIDGFVSHASYFPQEKLSIAICLNGARYPLNQLLIDFLSIAFDQEDYQLPSFEITEVADSVLQQYVGTYKSANFPLDIKVFIEEGRLKAQATGQASFALESKGDDSFQFLAAGIKMKFLPQQNEMHFEQGAMKVLFKR